MIGPFQLWLRGFGGIRVIVVRPPERREVPAEVQFEVAPNTVTDITNLRTARLRSWQGQQWAEQVVARLKLGSCRRPEPIVPSGRKTQTFSDVASPPRRPGAPTSFL